MPHAHSSSAASSGGDDLGSTDEVKVFKDEGDGEDEKRSSENLLEEKSSLIDWTESEEKSAEHYPGKLSVKSDLSPVFGKFEPHPAAGFNMGYLMAPYPYPNGGAHPLPVSMTGKMGLPAGGSLSLFCPGELGQPPPAHMGIPPPYQLDSKLAAGLARTPMYPFPGGTYPYPMLSPEMSQVAASWHTPSMYPISSAASGFRSPYPTSLPISSSSLSSELYRFSPTLGGGLGLGLGPALVPPPPSKSDLDSHHSRYARSLEKGSSSSSSDKPSESSANTNNKEQNKKPHIKKPLNAFMLYMKEMRAKVVAECTLKESAAINQILGRRWHSLSREEQAKYYEKARQERQLHMQLYPGWSARDNYGYGSKKKKRKKDRSPAELGGNNLKKCRARYGLDQQNQWCKPCRRKKKCVRYMEALAAAGARSPCSDSDVKLEELSDASSDDADTPLNSASSPGALSALSADHGARAYITYADLRSIRDFRNQTVIPIKAPPDTRLSVPHPDEKGYMIHLKSMSGEIEVYLCPKERPPSPASTSGQLPADPLLEDNKALLAPLIALLQSKGTNSITADFTTPIKREPGSDALVVSTPCATDPTLPLPRDAHDARDTRDPHTPQHQLTPRPHHTPLHESMHTPDSGTARGRLRNALIADSDDFAPIMGGGRFQLQTEDQESEPLELEPFLALEPPMSATDYGFCLDHDEGLAELFDFEF